MRIGKRPCSSSVRSCSTVEREAKRVGLMGLVCPFDAKPEMGQIVKVGGMRLVVPPLPIPRQIRLMYLCSGK